jgi:hypothetical protein
MYVLYTVQCIVGTVFLRDLDSPVIQAKVEDMFKNSTDLSQLFAGNLII